MLPFFLLRQVRIASRRQFFGLCLVFSLGGVTIATSIARTVAIAVFADTTQVVVWSVLETGIGIIVACCPALRVLLRNAGDSGSSQSRRTTRGTNALRLTSTRRETRDIDTLSDHKFPLVKVTSGHEIIKQVDFAITSESVEGNPHNQEDGIKPASDPW